MFLTIPQIKAARALLEWDQEELALRANLNVNQVRRLETGRARPLDVMEAIHKTFIRHDLAFVDDGVIKRRPEVRTLYGQSGFWSFYDDVYETIKEQGGCMMICGVIETLFWKWLGERRLPHRERMLALNNFSQKIIVQEGSFTPKESYATTEFKTLPPEQFPGVPFYLYGNKLAIINFDPDDVQIFIMTHPNIAKAYEKIFLALWDICKEPEEFDTEAGKPGKRPQRSGTSPKR